MRGRKIHYNFNELNKTYLSGFQLEIRLNKNKLTFNQTIGFLGQDQIIK